MTGGGVSDVEPLTPVDTADRAAEALRALNHLTLAAPAAGVPGWEGVDDIYRVLGELRTIADRLPQVCDQLVAGLRRLGDRRAWRSDEGTTEHPDEVVSTAIEHLRLASCDADELGLHIQHAHCAVAHLYQ
jgi:hypothetical protein